MAEKLETHLSPHRDHHQRCHLCGYDLFGTDGQKCPECGGEVLPMLESMELVRHDPIRRTARRTARLLIVTTLAAACVPVAVCTAIIVDARQGNGNRGLVSAVPIGLVGGAFAMYLALRLYLEVLVARLHRGLLPASKSDQSARRGAAIWVAHGLVAMVMAIIVIVPMDYLLKFHISDVTFFRTNLMIAVGASLLVMSLVVWRSTPLWKSVSIIAASLNLPRAAAVARQIAYIKLIYETIWLTFSWLPFAMVVPPTSNPLQPHYEAVAGVGMLVTLGYVLLLVPMLWVCVRLNHAVGVATREVAADVRATEGFGQDPG
jgi:hypothetical protein